MNKHKTFWSHEDHTENYIFTLKTLSKIVAGFSLFFSLYNFQTKIRIGISRESSARFTLKINQGFKISDSAKSTQNEISSSSSFFFYFFQ